MQLNFKIPGNDFLQETDIQTILTDVIETIESSTTRITPPALKKILFEKYGLTKKQIKTVIGNLVSAGELTYTYEFGSSFLERSFSKPVRISKYVVLTPFRHYHQLHPAGRGCARQSRRQRGGRGHLSRPICGPCGQDPAR